MKDYFLARKSVIVDLGVLFDINFFSFNHFNNICSEFSNALGFVIQISAFFQYIHLMYYSYVLNLKVLPLYFCASYVSLNLEKRWVVFISIKQFAQEYQILSFPSSTHTLSCPLHQSKNSFCFVYFEVISCGTI